MGASTFISSKLSIVKTNHRCRKSCKLILYLSELSRGKCPYKHHPGHKTELCSRPRGPSVYPILTQANLKSLLPWFLTQGVGEGGPGLTRTAAQSNCTRKPGFWMQLVYNHGRRGQVVLGPRGAVILMPLWSSFIHQRSVCSPC